MAKLHSITRHSVHMIKINQAFLLLSCALLAPHPHCIIRKPGTEATTALSQENLKKEYVIIIWGNKEELIEG